MLTTDDFRVFITPLREFSVVYFFLCLLSIASAHREAGTNSPKPCHYDYRPDSFCTFALILHPLSAHKHINLKPPPWVSYTCSCRSLPSTFSLSLYTHTRCSIDLFVRCLPPPPSPPPPFPHFLPPILPLSVSVSSSASPYLM